MKKIITAALAAILAVVLAVSPAGGVSASASGGCAP